MGSAAVAILGGGGKASGGRVLDRQAGDLGDWNGLLKKNITTGEQESILIAKRDFYMR